MDILNSILDNIDDGLVIINPAGEVLLCNSEANRIQIAISDTSIHVGKNVLDIVTEEKKAWLQEILQEVNHQKQAYKTFAEFYTPRGTKLFVELNFIPFVNDEGQVTHINIISLDVTAQKIFEKKVSALAADVTNVIDNANAIILGVDSRGYIIEWNKHCHQVTGYEKNDAYSQKFTELLLEEKDHPEFERLLRQVLRNESVDHYEIPIRTRERKELILMLSATPRVTTNGTVNGVTFVGQDITELTEYRRSLEKKIEERTLELQRALNKEKEVVEMKSRFVSIASHEFRTPLSSIQFATRFIKQHHHKIGIDELNQKLDNIEKQIQHMTHLLDDVLTYGKSESGKIKLVLTTIPVREFVSRIVEEVGHSTRNTHTIEYSLKNLPESISTDEKLLRNILINLFTNAIKFSPGKERVFFSMEKTDDHIVFEVRDEGVGIPADEIDKIFEPFLRGTSADAIQGTGLGLSIVKKAVELLQGSIAVKSQPGAGSTFIVKIPNPSP